MLWNRGARKTSRRAWKGRSGCSAGSNQFALASWWLQPVRSDSL